MYAVIQTGGKQYSVSEGQKITVEKLPNDIGSEIKLDSVTALIKDDKCVFGNPYIGDIVVYAEVIGWGKKDKVLVFKHKPRKGHRRLRGHRQPFTVLRIKEIRYGT